MSIKKKILMGLLSGALLLTGSQALANPSEPPAEMEAQEKIWQEKEAEHIGGWAKYLSEKYGVESAQVETALNNGVHIEDVKHAAVLAKLSGKSFSDVLAMKVDWAQVAEKLGVKREQVKEFYEQERLEFFAKMANTDAKTFSNLLKEGYDPHDIMIAGRIANAASKNVKSVLEKRKINNTWGDVAKSFGVDLQKLMPPDHPKSGRHGQSRHGQSMSR